ncbi:peritrophic membrane [Brachionus plicatilis]|uniref:Peritrophic membrane n=1 Tax=Brachionus plicatilis TaxID=10195 RepID=A0A3M7R4V8_BRAPC|nr:peritrophic membrane [Brachionus plicatilis]
MFKLCIALSLIYFCQPRNLHKRQDVCDPEINLTPVEGTCNQFNRCTNGFYAVGTCPGTYQFDETAKRCKPADEVNCTPKGNECSSDQDFTAVAGDCSKFNRCNNGYLTQSSCPSGLLFDKTLKICNYPDQVTDCDSTSTGDSGSNKGECTSAEDLTQVPEDCKQFYRCANGARSTQSCPSGTLFDNSLKVCNWADKVSCSSGSSSSGDSASGTCSSSDDLTQVPGKCGSFYRCANGVRFEQACPGGTNFDSNLKVCNWPDQVSCV